MATAADIDDRGESLLWISNSNQRLHKAADLGIHDYTGVYAARLQTRVPPHGVVMLKVSPIVAGAG